ncbi:tail fiber protein [Aequorivita marina]|uniref:tail fiber protein n=1 Tax=Aequorivita marina TaxID=3073654 RepID=UPI002875ECFA|nr:tail fiber protein [Aequorivita sp. S2608]MDS1296817.1 tail fiber protein [Aequorivita sp. S2608]
MKQFLLFTLVLFSVSATAQRNPFKNLTEKNGKIGIGTSNPDELLTVKGKIHTQEVLVDLNGAVAPDYVFEKHFTGTSEAMPDYDLISLEELEAFLKENNHLPKLPSAQQMQEEGLSLKQMNLILLEKIEELTLYTIQQQKEIEILKEKISSK